MLKGRDLGNLWVDTPDFHPPMSGEVVGHPGQEFGAAERHVGLTNTTAPPINRGENYCGLHMGWCLGFNIFQGHFVSINICSQTAKGKYLFF